MCSVGFCLNLRFDLKLFLLDVEFGFLNYVFNRDFDLLVISNLNFEFPRCGYLSSYFLFENT